MAEYQRFTVSLDVAVTDPRAAIRAARDNIRQHPENGGRPGDIRSARDAVHWLLDPGSLFEAGIEIEESRIEESRIEAYDTTF